MTLTSSGTHALQIALARVPTKVPGPPRVALPGYSCYDLVSAAVGAGVRVRFYDLDPLSLTPERASFEAALHDGVDAAVVANLFGYPMAWGDLRRTAEEYGVVLIEDAAQGLGTRSDGGDGGSMGIGTVLSFGRGKGWTGGGGGALLERDGGVGEEAHAVLGGGSGGLGSRAMVTSTVAWLLGRPSLYGIPTSIPTLGLGETHYRDPTRPVAISRFSAALALETEAASRDVVESRRTAAASWSTALDDAALPACSPVGGPDAASFLRFAVLAQSPDQAEAFASAAAQHGVVRGYPRPLHELPQSQPILTGSRPELPGCERLASCLLTLPTHGWVTSADVDSVVQTWEGIG